MKHDGSPPKATDDHKLTREDDDELDGTQEMLHQFGTPLTIISGYVQLLRRRSRTHPDKDDAMLDRSLQAIESAVERMRDAVANVRDGRDDPDDGDRPEPPARENDSP